MDRKRVKKDMIYTINFHFSKNYGALLQSYALQKFFIRDTAVINYIPEIKNMAGKRLKDRIPIFWRLIAILRSVKFFFPFSELSYLTKTEKYSGKSLNLQMQNKTDSTFVTGSDQVWNPDLIYRREKIYFLDFCPDSAKRISYAASLGMTRWPLYFEQRVLPMLKKFDAISVREESAVKYLSSLGLKDVVCVCDPTILHNVDFYRQQFRDDVSLPSSPYTFVYKVREKIPQSVQHILANSKTLIVNLKRQKTLCSVTQWLANIENAQFIITDSFHCVVFCLLFHKSFIILPNRSKDKGMNERFSSLLGKTSLEYRVLSCDESSEQVLDILNRPIDWDHIDDVFEKWRFFSRNWLENAIKKTNRSNTN